MLHVYTIDENIYQVIFLMFCNVQTPTLTFCQLNMRYIINRQINA